MKNLIKRKNKNKLIIILIIIIIWIISFSVFSKPKIDTKSYIVLIKWDVKINDYHLKKEQRLELKVWDIIISEKKSACVIEWWDWSITRLWEKWKIEIQELNVVNDLSKINLQFKLTKWKTWSNVVSFLWDESYFKQNFEDIQASVRWTIFDVNLVKDYIYVANHEVKVQKWNNQEMISENKAFSISNFSFIEIEEFIKNIKDKTWQQLNSQLDKTFLNNLKKDISKKIDLENIEKVITDNKSYKELLYQYQKLNFISPKDNKLFEVKNKIRKELITKASNSDKENLLKYSVFDLKDAIDYQNIDSIKSSLSTIWKNKDILGNLSNDIKNIISDFNIPEFNIKNIDVNPIKDKAESLRNDAINKLKNLNFEL